MALALLNTLPTNEFLPKIGCGLVYCLEEEDYVITAGKKSFIPIIFNLLGAIFDGDTMLLHGVLFTFTASPPTTATEIEINGAFTAANVFATLSAYPFFADNYDITQPNQYEVYIENKIEQIDNDYNFVATTANANSIMINPVYPPLLIQSGLNPVVKEDYFVFMDVIDVLNGETKICSTSFGKPLNVFTNGDNKVCFDVQKIIEDYQNIFTLRPLPTISALPNVWNWYDENFEGQFRFRFYSSYKDPNSLNCERLIGTIITEPTSLGLRVVVVNMIQEIDADYDITDFSYFNSTPPIRAVTTYPVDYKFCPDTVFEWRVDFPVDLINNVFGGLALLNLYYNYTDGTTDVWVLFFDSDYDGMQIVVMNLGVTIPAANPNKTLDNINAEVVQSILALPPVVISENTWYFDNESDRCCKCHKQFYFLSKFGNNETMIGRCEYRIDFEVENFESCKEFTCGGDTTFNTPNFDGGSVTINVDKSAKPFTVLIECNNEQYLTEFLESTVKYVYENDKLYRITQLETSYQVYQVNDSRFLVEFKYKKSIDSVRRTFSQ